MFLRMRAQSSNARHDLVLHNAVFQTEIVGPDEVAERLDHVSERGGSTVAQRWFFGGFFLRDKRSDKS